MFQINIKYSLDDERCNTPSKSGKNKENEVVERTEIDFVEGLCLKKGGMFAHWWRIGCGKYFM
ncbi:11452_t:CDS:2, partial [Racocetra persica]